MIRIVIADDHKLFRQTLSEVLQTNPAYEVIAQCEDSSEAVDIVLAEKPDITLMDINIAPFSGIEAVKRMTPSRVIGLSMHAHPAYAKKMMKAGAMGYITKNSSKEEIFAGIREVVKGNRFICSEIKDMLSHETLTEAETAPHIGLLTRRELEIAGFISEGLSSKEIAGQLQVALKTIEVHRHNILKKLKLKNASNLVNFMHVNAGFIS
ncbi:MAG TPA: response regulator transcription factor [Chitinophagaceae bacterium]|nr:response regulator transcription factor [Chitinophagaceae bacterium]